jgi:dipeptidase D
MVCEKNSDKAFDFDKDTIEVRNDGGWVTACGTSLGADNGMGLAASLAIAEDESAAHGPLELLFTVDEETGLNGANGLQPGFLRGRILLNLDSEDEGVFFIGCAGGADTETTMTVGRKAKSGGKALKVHLSGLRGGHSGLDIDKGKGNATQLLARMLYRLDIPFGLVTLEGGTKHNAIPREAFAHVEVPEKREGDFRAALENRFKEIRFEYRTAEKDMKLSVEPAPVKGPPSMDKDSQDQVLGLLVGIPHGVAAMSMEIPGLVETSNNLAIVRVKGRKVLIHTSTRSSVQSALEALREKLAAVGRLAGAKVNHLSGYPSWTPDLDSKLLKTMKTVYRNLYGTEPKVETVHAGLECGIIGKKYPGMDMISFGPTLRNPHSPDERVHVESVDKFYELLKAVLKSLA